MQEPNDQQRQLLTRHLELVLKANEKTNITRITSLEEGTLLHIEDSLAALPELHQAPAGKYADLGTGGGFPGIPLAIMSDRQTLLVDSVGKKTAILDGIIKQLHLEEQVGTYTGRIEDLAREQPAFFSALTARALSKLPSLIELGSPLLTEGGMMICYKAQVEQDEIFQAQALEEKTGMRLVSDRSFSLSDGTTKRRIITFEKVAQPLISLPRKTGLAQKRPLKP